jgi:cysteine desulfurase / selenocysteine lyase
MSFAAKVGLGIAVEQCLEIGTTAIWHRVQTLAHVLREALSAGDVPHVRLRDRGKTLCGIVSFTVDEKPCSEIVNALRSQNINVSVSKRPSSRFDFEKRQLDEVVRASVHYYNTEEECHRLVEAIAKMV